MLCDAPGRIVSFIVGAMLGINPSIALYNAVYGSREPDYSALVSASLASLPPSLLHAHQYTNSTHLPVFPSCPVAWLQATSTWDDDVDDYENVLRDSSGGGGVGFGDGEGGRVGRRISEEQAISSGLAIGHIELSSFRGAPTEGGSRIPEALV